MGVIAYDQEITCSIPPEKLFKASVLDADNLLPQIMPQAFKSVEVLEGDGGPGTIKQINFGEGSQYKSVKHRVDSIDKDNFTYSYSIIEGDVLDEGFDSISYDVKIEATPEGGSVCKTTSKYHTKPNIHIAEEKIKEGKEKAKAMFKAIEAHLHAHPHAY